MKTFPSRFALRLGALVAVAGLIVSSTALQAVAQDGSLSDELLILSPLGTALDSLIPETAGADTQPSVIWDPTGTLTTPPGLVPAGSLTGLGLIAPGLPALGGFTYVILAEPAGQPVDPTGLPPVFYSTPTGDVQVSDVLFNGLNSDAFLAGQLPPLIGLLSDNNSDLSNLVPLLPAGIPVIFENGTLQDLTALMGSNIVDLRAVGGPVFPVQVLVRSDVSSVPEPSTIVLAGLGILGLSFVARRKKYRRA